MADDNSAAAALSGAAAGDAPPPPQQREHHQQPSPSTSTAQPQPQPQLAAAAAAASPPRKVVVVFRAAGDAPVLKVSKFKVDESARFAKVNNFLTTQLQAYLSSVNPESAGGAGTAAPSVFCYLNSAFTPSLEERLSALRDDYGADGRLVVHYALKPAWG
ncbi:ubiquitin-like protein ATG12 [Pycnococcus provasolii]